MDENLIAALRGGEVALLTTDTVYGLAALAGSAGVERIFELKHRPATQSLPWLVSGLDDLTRYGEDRWGYASRLAATFWPGALTLVLPATQEARGLGGLAEDGTVALRCPDEPTCLELLSVLDGPVACTSANLHGQPAPSRLCDVDAAFLGLPGAASSAPECAGGLPSTIIDCTGRIPRVLRKGAIPARVAMDVALFGVKLLSRQTNEGTSMDGSRIAIASDHGGYEQKQQICDWLSEKGYTFTDYGVDSEESVDYPDYAALVAHAIVDGEADFGVLVCGTGIGMAIAANKVPGIRAANITDPGFAILAREHNDANIITLSGRFVDLDTNIAAVEAFLTTGFSGERHARRVAKITDLEQGR